MSTLIVNVVVAVVALAIGAVVGYFVVRNKKNGVAAAVAPVADKVDAKFDDLKADLKLVHDSIKAQAKSEPETPEVKTDGEADSK